MASFAFLVHPATTGDVPRRYPLAAHVPGPVLEAFLRYAPPRVLWRVTGIRSAYGEVDGWIIATPLTVAQMGRLPRRAVTARILRAAKLAERLGASIIGLGGHTATACADLAPGRLNMPVTSGARLAVALAVEGVREASRYMGMDLRRARVAVAGGAGDTGVYCSLMLARQVRHLTLLGPDSRLLGESARTVMAETGLAARIASNPGDVLPWVDILILTPGLACASLNLATLKPGAIICDLTGPEYVSRRLGCNRDDVLVFEGGLVEIPGAVRFQPGSGNPCRLAGAALAETLILALEGPTGPTIQFESLPRLARKHGFRLVALCRLGEPISIETLNRIRRRAAGPVCGPGKGGSSEQFAQFLTTVPGGSIIG